MQRHAMTRQGRELISKAMEQYSGDMIWSGSDVRWTGGDECCIAAETLGEDGIRVEMN